MSSRRAHAARRFGISHLAAEAGYTTGVVNLTEAGHTNPGWHTVRCVARALGVPIGELALAVEAIESQEETDAA